MMSSLKFIDIEVLSKYFHKQRQVTDNFTIHANNVVLSGKVSCNSGQYWQYTVSCQVDRKTMVLLDHRWCKKSYIHKMLR